MPVSSVHLEEDDDSGEQGNCHGSLGKTIEECVGLAHQYQDDGHDNKYAKNNNQRFGHLAQLGLPTLDHISAEESSCIFASADGFSTAIPCTVPSSEAPEAVTGMPAVPKQSVLPVK